MTYIPIKLPITTQNNVSRHALYIDPGIGGLHGFQAGLADGNDVNGLTVRNRDLTRFKKRNQRL